MRGKERERERERQTEREREKKRERKKRETEREGVRGEVEIRIVKRGERSLVRAVLLNRTKYINCFVF